MLRTWRSFSRPVGMPAERLGEIALVGALAIALAFSWTDGAPDSRSAAAVVVPIFEYTASAGGYSDQAHNRTPVAPPPVPEAPIPNAPPTQIVITSLNVHRPIEPIGLDSSGRMDVPVNLWNAGWYKGGPVPGAPGDAVIEGHAGYPDAPLLFAKIGRLATGDRIVISLADGTQQLFLVESTTIYPAGSSPPDMGQPYGPPRLTLITCTGPFDTIYKTYSDRLVVEASYAGLA